MKTVQGSFLIMLVTFLLSSFSLPMKGQNAESLENVTKENVALESNVKELRQDTLEIKEQISKLNAEVKQLDSRLSELSSESYRLTEAMSKDAVASLKTTVDSLTAELNKRKKHLAEAENSYKANQGKLEKTNNSIRDMQAFSIEQQKIIYAENKEILCQRYSSITDDALNEIVSTQESFKDFDGYDDYKRRIGVAHDNKSLYEKGDSLINSPFNWTVIVKTREKIIPLLKIKADQSETGIYKLSPQQFNEMDTLDIKLSRYKGGVQNLQSVIKTINQNPTIKQYRQNNNPADANACWEKIKELLPKEGDDSYKRFYQMIPYLKKMLRDYFLEVKSNPLVNTKVEEIINDIKIDQ